MKQKRFTSVHMLCAVLAGALAMLLAATLTLWLLLGTQGLSLLTAWNVVRTRFVGEYDPDRAADAAISGLVSGLDDRWSYYLDAGNNKLQSQRRDNTYVGVGITVSYADPRGLLILSVRSGGPAEQGGLRPGEVITAVDGVSVAGEGQSGGVDAIQGKEGSRVTLTVLDGAGESREVSLTRRSLQNLSVEYELLEGGVGYVDVENFYTYSAGQLAAAVDDLVDRGARGLVFDMRNNGGGYVDELTDMLDHLLPEGPVFRSREKWGGEAVTGSDENYVNLPMAVLVNGDTYSAAEFFAAQLQETAGAVVVGEETSGKGYSQQSSPLPNGGALNLSTGKYTTGAGVSLVGTGVRLDAEVVLDGEESRALRAGTLAHGADPQLQRALEELQLS